MMSKGKRQRQPYPSMHFCTCDDAPSVAGHEAGSVPRSADDRCFNVPSDCRSSFQFENENFRWGEGELILVGSSFRTLLDWTCGFEIEV